MKDKIKERFEEKFKAHMKEQGALIKKANGSDCCPCYEDDFHTAMMIARDYSLTFIEKALTTQKKEIVEMIDIELDVMQDGIQACKDDCGDAKGGELRYIYGKSHALKIMEIRLKDIKSKINNETL